VWSLPFGTYGGPVGGDDARDLLLSEFGRRLREPGVIEVGWVDLYGEGSAAGWEAIECSTHVVDLSGGFEAVWRDRFDKSRRRRVRRAEEQGVTVRRAGGRDDVASFVTVYRSRLREWDAGAGHPDRLFQSLLERGGERVRLYLAIYRGAVVGGHLNFYYKGEVIAWYGMTAANALGTQAGTLLYATCMREACRDGFTTYNLGSSPLRRSLVEYKESLGGTVHRYRMLRRRRLLGRVVSLLRGRSRS
jgi:CelD/BcsL family acetyltransferase involved in cellulose biosynthesis